MRYTLLRKLTHWPILFLFGEILVFYRKVLFQPLSYGIPWDFQYFHYNAAEYLAASLRQGHIPLWDPFSYCGAPFFANMTSQIFYPPALVTAFLANIIDPSRLMFGLVLCEVAHVFFAGIVTYWLLRTADCSRLAALIGATALQLGCCFASQIQHLGGIEGIAWLPLGALAVLKLSSRTSPRWIAILAIAIAASILAGYPSGAASVLLGTLFLVAGLSISSHARLKLLASYAVGAFAGAVLAAIQLIPTLQVATQSVSKYRGDWFGQGSGLRLEALPSLVWPNYYHILDLRGYNLPYNFTFLYLYCGIAVIALAVVAVIMRRHPLAIPFTALTLLSALFMHGDATPIGKVLIHAVAHDSIYPEFIMAGFSLGVALLAGLGANLFSSRPMLLTALLAFTILDLTYVGSGRPMNTRSFAEEPGVTPHHFDGNVEILTAVRGCINRSDPPARLDTYGDSMSWAVMAPTVRVPTATGNDPFALNSFMNVRRLFCGGARWGRYYEVTQLDSPILDLLNVGCMISRAPLPPNSKWRLASTLPGHMLYQSASALPRFFFVHRIMAASDMPDAIERMRLPDFAPGQVAVVQGMPAREYVATGTSEVRVVHYGSEEVILDVGLGAGAFLVSSEANYPGWRATIDNKPAQIVPTNAAFRGLEIPAGHHRIRFYFSPQSLWWGAALSAVGVAAVCFALSICGSRPFMGPARTR